jgi:hypothetical protein
MERGTFTFYPPVTFPGALTNDGLQWTSVSAPDYLVAGRTRFQTANAGHRGDKCIERSGLLLA